MLLKITLIFRLQIKYVTLNGHVPLSHKISQFFLRPPKLIDQKSLSFIRRLETSICTVWIHMHHCPWLGIGAQKCTHTHTHTHKQAEITSEDWQKESAGDLCMYVCVRLKQAESAGMFYLERKEKRNKKKKWVNWIPFYCQGEFWQDKLRTHSSLATVQSSPWPKQPCSQCYTHTHTHTRHQ